MTADAGMTEADLDRFERAAEPVYRSTVEAGNLHRFAVSDLGGFTLRLVAEVRRLRAENGRLRAHIGQGVTAEPLTVDDLDALPEGESVVATPGGIWVKGEGENWHRPQRDGMTKVRSSAWLAQCSPTLAYRAAVRSGEQGGEGRG